MRVLILSAILACVAAAPSVPVLAIAPIIPAAIPRLSSGDLQAAAIDTKVQIEDQARAIADQNQAIADQNRAIADQARLAADVAKEQAELDLKGQKILTYAAAPVAPIAPVIAIPIAAPTLSPGDLQAAAIDAKVKAEDEARALADQARLEADVARNQAELALEGQKEKIEEVTAIVKEKNEDLFWNVEDKKWQAIDAVKTVEAKLDGAVASNADAIAKSLTYPAVSPIVYQNVLYPGTVGVGVQTQGFIPLVNDKLVKTGDVKEKPEETKTKLEMAPQIELVGGWGAPIVYQPGLLGASLPLQTVLLRQW